MLFFSLRLDARDLGRSTRYYSLVNIYHTWDRGTDHRAPLVSLPTQCMAVLAGRASLSTRESIHRLVTYPKHMDVFPATSTHQRTAISAPKTLQAREITHLGNRDCTVVVHGVGRTSLRTFTGGRFQLSQYAVRPGSE